MKILREAELRAQISALFGVGNRYEVVHIRLFKNDLTPTPDTVVADLTEADFDGYADFGPVVWGAVFTNPDGYAEIVGGVAQFTDTGAVTPNTIYGYYATDAAGTGLFWAERFEDPITMDENADAILVIPRFVQAQS